MSVLPLVMLFIGMLRDSLQGYWLGVFVQGLLPLFALWFASVFQAASYRS